MIFENSVNVYSFFPQDITQVQSTESSLNTFFFLMNVIYVIFDETSVELQKQMDQIFEGHKRDPNCF